MHDVEFTLASALLPGECVSRLSQAIAQKVWIVTGEPRWESNYVTGEATSGKLLLRNHEAWGNSPTYAAATVRPTLDGTMITGRICYDQTTDRWNRWSSWGGMIFLGLFALLCLRYVPHTIPLTFKNLWHRPYRSTLVMPVLAIGWVGYMNFILRTKHRAEGKLLRRFLMKILEAREQSSPLPSENS